MDSFVLNDAFMVPTDRFYHYNGSLTTPPCSEAVQWVVFTNDSYISHDQVKICSYILSPTISFITVMYQLIAFS